jgi:hypothetical protein
VYKIEINQLVIHDELAERGTNSPYINHFLSPDSIIPEQSQGVQAWDRYAYANNNPVRYNDPTGHCIICVVVNTMSVVMGSILNPSPATRQAVGLVASWFTELGPQTRTFGPDEPITKEVMQQGGVDSFHEAWANSGYEDNFSAKTTIDDRTSGSVVERVIEGTGILVKAHMIDLPLSLLGVEGHSAIPGTIGSLDEISASYTDDGKIRIEVHNTMGWASGIRIPGTSSSVIQNRDRSEFGPGGTIEQYFYWYEEVPKGKKGQRQ